MFNETVIQKAAVLLNGDEALARQVAKIFEDHILANAGVVKRGSLTPEQRRIILTNNLTAANEKREQNWAESQGKVRKIISDMKAADPNVRHIDICVALNQANIPTYRPLAHPSWTVSMVRRFIRETMRHDGS